jgi:hypothetical protein
MIEDNIRRKIETLIQRSPSLVTLAATARDTRHLAQCDGWITEALNVVEVAVPSPTNAYRARISKVGHGAAVQRVASMAEILRALLLDIDAGLLARIIQPIDPLVAQTVVLA